MGDTATRFWINGRQPVPLRPGESPPATFAALTAAQVLRRFRRYTLAQLADLWEQTCADVPEAMPFPVVADVRAKIAELRRTGIPPMTAMYSVVAIVLDDVAFGLDDPGFDPGDPPHADDRDDGLDRRLKDALRQLKATVDDLLTRHAAADARRLVGHTTRKAADDA